MVSSKRGIIKDSILVPEIIFQKFGTANISTRGVLKDWAKGTIQQNKVNTFLVD